jgi:hypothetical protein
LLGLGGIGKSRLALELVYQVKSEFPHYSILWINAADQSTFEKDILEIGKKLRIPGIEYDQVDAKRLVKQRLSDSSAERWLVVLDNADDEAVWGKRSNTDNQQSTLVDWLPSTTHGSILITTRSRRVASYLAGKEVTELHALSPDEASRMFINALKKPEMAADRDAVSILLNKLTYLPLAIAQAASHINTTEEKVATYLRLVDKGEEVPIVQSGDFSDRSHYSIADNLQYGSSLAVLAATSGLFSPVPYFAMAVIAARLSYAYLRSIRQDSEVGPSTDSGYASLNKTSLLNENQCENDDSLSIMTDNETLEIEEDLSTAVLLPYSARPRNRTRMTHHIYSPSFIVNWRLE